MIPPAAGTLLVPTIPSNFADAVNSTTFFSTRETGLLRQFANREQPDFSKPTESCKTNLFFGFFFDGTKNNYMDAEKGRNHSNVARLYDCFPGQSVPGILPREMDWKYQPEQFKNFFKVYIPGVASRFDAVKDEGGDGIDGAGGGGSGLFGERRIIWAMVQAINNVHRFFLKTPLISPDATLALTRNMILNHARRQAMALRGADARSSAEHGDKVDTRRRLESLLNQLNAAIKPFRNPAQIRDPGYVKVIHMSTFGFSRGATQARAFNNWMLSLCELDAHLTGAKHTHSLGGIPVSFDFLGLYDTVASVGAGNTFGNVPGLKMFDGHMAWADAENSLRVRPGVPCVHLIAAHELRRSFPVDSISVKGTLPPDCWEIVVPGVHSDLGCGYAPMEQGKGTDPAGTDMLARIPLIMMYKMARLKGVPLKLEHASPVAQARFVVKPEVISDLNNYLMLCRVTSGSLTAIMRDQARMQMEWRLWRRSTGANPIEKTAFYARSTMLDQNDFHSANMEFEQEIAEFQSWFKAKAARYVHIPQEPGFKNERDEEWKAIAKWFNPRYTPPEAVAKFFDEYVHDSRSWFKLIPGNPDSMAKVHAQLKGWVKKRDTQAAQRALTAKLKKENNGVDPRYRNMHFGTAPEDRDWLTPEQLKAADEYAKSGEKVIPRMITTGREPYAWKSYAGYLRYRKIYGGSDDDLLSAVPDVDGQQLDEIARTA